jgi:PAS domain S-box-containing protein
MVAGAANAPVFGLFDVYLNHGEVGGYLSSLSDQGKVAGGMALRILRGEKPQDIPKVKGANAYMFDWRALKRWGLNERQLPPGSIVINRQPTVWEAYKQYIILGSAVMFAEALLIFALLWQRKRRRESELHVRESEERFRLVANTAPVMIWMSGLDKKPTYFNQLWLNFTGLSETDLRNGLAGIVHPEDYLQGHDVYCRGFDQRQPFRKECRLRRHDGQYRWMLDIGVPRFHKDGSFAGYIGSCIDVTENKRAEEALSDMTRKLVAAQEKERTRIARELHDDISQRLAMLAVELEQVQNDPSEIQQRVSELRKQTTEISNGVQALSHDLHSSQLEYLGAVAGMKSWCKEFGERQGMQIDCRQDVRSTLPQEIGLCLFRVLQEALHNAVKHSGVKRIEVQLHEESDEIHLTIMDLGKGFDVEAAKKGHGLGLTSMQERVRAVHGKIAIESKPMGGTTIHVRVPFSSEKLSERAVG